MAIKKLKPLGLDNFPSWIGIEHCLRWTPRTQKELKYGKEVYELIRDLLIEEKPMTKRNVSK
jgi:hypothetical protein